MRQGKSHRDRRNMIVRAGGILLLMTLLSFRMVSSLYAGYASGEMTGNGAAIAAGGIVTVAEHQACFDRTVGEYRLNPAQIVTANTYEVVVPGMKIEKDPFIQLPGNNDVSYTLYLEVTAAQPAIVRYTMSDDWQESQRMAAQHGGKVYVYHHAVRPHEQGTITGLLSDAAVYITSELRDKRRPDANGAPFRVDMYAYLVQSD